MIAVNLFHHINNPDRILTEINRVLKNGGKLIVSDFNKKGRKIVNSLHKGEGRNHEDFGRTTIALN